MIVGVSALIPVFALSKFEVEVQQGRHTETPIQAIMSARFYLLYRDTHGRNDGVAHE